MNDKKEKEPTQEEVDKYLKLKSEYIKTALPLIRLEKEYEELKASISKSIYMNNMYKVKLARILAPQATTPKQENTDNNG